MTFSKPLPNRISLRVLLAGKANREKEKLLINKPLCLGKCQSQQQTSRKLHTSFGQQMPTNSWKVQLFKISATHMKLVFRGQVNLTEKGKQKNRSQLATTFVSAFKSISLQTCPATTCFVPQMWTAVCILFTCLMCTLQVLHIIYPVCEEMPKVHDKNQTGTSLIKAAIKKMYTRACVFYVELYKFIQADKSSAERR